MMTNKPLGIYLQIILHTASVLGVNLTGIYPSFYCISLTTPTHALSLSVRPTHVTIILLPPLSQHEQVWPLWRSKRHGQILLTVFSLLQSLMSKTVDTANREAGVMCVRNSFSRHEREISWTCFTPNRLFQNVGLESVACTALILFCLHGTGCNICYNAQPPSHNAMHSANSGKLMWRNFKYILYIRHYTV